MMKYLVISKTKWNKRNFKNLSKNVKFLNYLNSKVLKKYNPNIIFFIHWSIFVPKKIYSKYLCIQFHSSDLPDLEEFSIKSNYKRCQENKNYSF